MKRVLFCVFLAAVVCGLLVLPTAIAESTVHGTAKAFYLVPNPGGTPPVKDGAPVMGAKGTIHRNSSGVTINLHTVGLAPGHAYTVWVIEVNCGAAACIPIQLAGHIVGKSGSANFGGHLGFNDDARMAVQDPFGGDFHCIIADHGPLNPEDLPDAIKTGLPPFAPDGTQNWKQVFIFTP